jgi:adenine deaminase
MAACTRAIEAMQGGLVATVDGEVVAKLPLPLAGLLSDVPATGVIQQLEALNTSVCRIMGSRLPAPFMSLSFLSLPTVPELGLTDMGLVHVRDQELISPLVGD